MSKNNNMIGWEKAEVPELSAVIQSPYISTYLRLLPDVICVNPLPDLPILGSSNLAANKDMKSKVWTNRDTII